MLEQVLGDRHRIGEDLHPAAGQRVHHLECRRAAVDDDRLAIGTEVDRGARDRLFLLDPDRFIDREGPAGKPDELRRRDRLCPAPHTAQLFLHMQGGDVAPDGRLRHAGQVHKVDHGHDRTILDRLKE